MKYLIKSILAGFMIGMGAVCFLSIDNKIVGAFMFSIGLLVIVTRELNLYTGKIGYLIVNGKKFVEELFITLCGNLIGALYFGFAMRFTRIADVIVKKADALVKVKADDSLISILILSIACGLLMYIAVNGYKTIKEDLGKYIVLMLCVSGFILCGFEHCIANMVYFTIADAWSSGAVLYMLVMILGNSLGAFIIPIGEKLMDK